jgi:DUF4097 and DUF4098 domain-containing protein YvlB
MSKVWIRSVGLLALAVTAAACDITVGAFEFKVREEKRFTVSGPARVNLSTFDGSVEIRGWDRPEVLVEVEKQAPDQATADLIKVGSRQEGNSITIDIPQPSGFTNRNWHQTPSASLVVSMPLNADLVVRSGDGSVSIRRVSGTFDIKTEDGSIAIDEHKGDVVARTGDGSVRLKDIDGAVDAETGDGSIAVDGVLRRVRLETNDGSITFTARQGSRMDTDWTMSTGDGSMRAELPKGFGAEVDAESGDGRVHVEGVSTREGERSGEDHEERRSVRGTIGTGGKLLKLRSGDGSITVRLW